MRILHVEYSLSPEYSVSTAVEESVTVYQALLQQDVLPSQMFIMGDSAGGGLSLLTVQSIIARQLPAPRGVIALSPWTDMSFSGESHTRNNLTDLLLTTEFLTWMTKQVSDACPSKLPLDDPTFSPLFGSFEGFPPTYITVGTAEILEDDSRRVVQKAREANVNVILEEGLHLLHGYPVFFLYYPEARNTLNNIRNWIETIPLPEANKPIDAA